MESETSQQKKVVKLSSFGKPVECVDISPLSNFYICDKWDSIQWFCDTYRGTLQLLMDYHPKFTSIPNVVSCSLRLEYHDGENQIDVGLHIADNDKFHDVYAQSLKYINELWCCDLHISFSIITPP